jgi:hypothetical protein
MPEWFDTDRGSVCGDCWHGACLPPLAEICDATDCRCQCRDRDGGRARELDDRPAETLAALARDMERERYAPPLTYTAERHGQYLSLLAERYGRPA